MEKYLQKFADFIIERVEYARTQQELLFWFTLGLTFNDWCVEKNIWLN